MKLIPNCKEKKKEVDDVSVDIGTDARQMPVVHRHHPLAILFCRWFLNLFGFGV